MSNLDNIKIGSYVIVSYDCINLEEIAEIISITDEEISGRIIINEHSPEFVGDVFAMPIEDINADWYKVASEEETRQINKKLVFK